MPTNCQCHVASLTITPGQHPFNGPQMIKDHQWHRKNKKRKGGGGAERGEEAKQSRTCEWEKELGDSQKTSFFMAK